MSRTPLEGSDPDIGLSSVPCQGLFSEYFSPPLRAGWTPQSLAIARDGAGVGHEQQSRMWLTPTPAPSLKGGEKAIVLFGRGPKATARKKGRIRG